MGNNYILKFNANTVKEPVTYNLIRNFNLKLNILKAGIRPSGGGSLLVELEAEDLYKQEAFEYLERKGIEVLRLESRIQFREEECVSCGACTAVCPTSALSLDRTSFQLIFDAAQCVACGICLKSCPLKLFRLDFGV